MIEVLREKETEVTKQYFSLEELKEKSFIGILDANGERGFYVHELEKFVGGVKPSMEWPQSFNSIYVGNEDKFFVFESSKELYEWMAKQ